MGQPVVHFEIIGRDAARLRSYYGELFWWDFHVGDAATGAVSQPGNYGFVDGSTTGNGINGGVGGGEGYEGRVLFYVGVPDVEDALQKAEKLGKRVMGPEGTSGVIVVGQFTDPEGHLIGVAARSSTPASACARPLWSSQRPQPLRGPQPARGAARPIRSPGCRLHAGAR